MLAENTRSPPMHLRSPCMVWTLLAACLCSVISAPVFHRKSNDDSSANRILQDESTDDSSGCLSWCLTTDRTPHSWCHNSPACVTSCPGCAAQETDAIATTSSEDDSSCPTWCKNPADGKPAKWCAVSPECTGSCPACAKLAAAIEDVNRHACASWCNQHNCQGGPDEL